MDSSVICHPSVVAKLEELALTGNIPCQKDILRFGGTDAGAIHQSRAGVYTGGISIPTRYVHTPLEVADLGDVEGLRSPGGSLRPGEADLLSPQIQKERNV